MGLGGISMWQLLIVLLIVIMIFGTKKLKSLGSDLGGAIKGFKGALEDADDKKDSADQAEDETATDQIKESSESKSDPEAGKDNL